MEKRELWASFPQLLAVPEREVALTMKALLYAVNEIGHVPTIDELQEWAARDRMFGTSVAGEYVESMLDCK